MIAWSRIRGTTLRNICGVRAAHTEIDNEQDSSASDGKGLRRNGGPCRFDRLHQ
jgi:hypothetical protein